MNGENERKVEWKGGRTVRLSESAGGLKSRANQPENFSPPSLIVKQHSIRLRGRRMRLSNNYLRWLPPCVMRYSMTANSEEETVSKLKSSA